MERHDQLRPFKSLSALFFILLAIIIVVVQWLPGLTARLQVNRGFLALINNQLPQAEAHFSQVTQNRPGMAEAWYGLGLVKSEQGKPGEAVSAYSTALDLDAGYLEPRLKRAEYYQDAGQLQLAESDWILLGSVEALIQHGYAAWNTGDTELARRYFLTAIHTFPNNWQGYYLLAFLLYTQGSYEDVEPLLKQALAAGPADPSSILMLQGRNDYALGRYQACGGKFTQYITLVPGDYMGWRWRGICAQALNNLPQAVSDFNQSAQLAPADPNAHIYLARVYLALNDPQRSLDEYQIVLQLQPGNEEALQAIVKIQPTP